MKQNGNTGLGVGLKGPTVNPQSLKGPSVIQRGSQEVVHFKKHTAVGNWPSTENMFGQHLVSEEPRKVVRGRTVCSESQALLFPSSMGVS